MKRRDMIRMSEAEVDAYLHDVRTLNVATINPDGHPHLVAMWYGFVDGTLVFWTYNKSQKILNLRRNPAITGLVESGASYDQLKGVELVGRGIVVDDPDYVHAVGEAVVARHTGLAGDALQQSVKVAETKRAAVRFEVDRVVSWDHTKLGGAY
jgi:PPOX class probable F420-dependent enzyme